MTQGSGEIKMHAGDEKPESRRRGGESTWENEGRWGWTRVRR